MVCEKKAINKKILLYHFMVRLDKLRSLISRKSDVTLKTKLNIIPTQRIVIFYASATCCFWKWFQDKQGWLLPHSFQTISRNVQTKEHLTKFPLVQIQKCVYFIECTKSFSLNSMIAYDIKNLFLFCVRTNYLRQKKIPIRTSVKWASQRQDYGPSMT